MNELSIDEIIELIPHQYPMLLVDKVVDVYESRIFGYKNVTFNEHFFQGHFPGKPIMPGVLTIEALAQLAGILLYKLNKEQYRGQYVYFSGIEKAKFRKIVKPGDKLDLECRVIKNKLNIWKFSSIASVSGEIASEAEISIIIAQGSKNND